MKGNPEEEYPFDDGRPVTVSMGLLYNLICGCAIAGGNFDGSEEARLRTLLRLTVSVPEAKWKMVNAGWRRGW